MDLPKFRRLPNHIGVIPDGNRRWAVRHGLSKEAGYERGIAPGFQLYSLCVQLGIEELTLYGFTQDNTKRPSVQTVAFQKACVDAVEILCQRDASLLVVGNHESPLFPPQLLPFTKERKRFGSGAIRLNFLVNYGWLWDLNQAVSANGNGGKSSIRDSLASADVSRIDLIIRWGGRRRLSGFLPVQSVYADFYILDDLWPDFRPEHLFEALRWYEEQDITLGG